MSWNDLLEQWPLVERDLADAGIDVGDDELMRSRSWRWLQTRIVGLLDRPQGGDLMGAPVFTTRLQRHFYGQPASDQAQAQG